MKLEAENYVSGYSSAHFWIFTSKIREFQKNLLLRWVSEFVLVDPRVLERDEGREKKKEKKKRREAELL